MTCRFDGSSRRSARSMVVRMLPHSHPLDSPHDRRDARQKFANAERLRQIIVSTVDERQHFVGLGARTGKDEDGCLGVGATLTNRPAESDAVQTRQRGIEHDEIERRRPETLERLSAIDAFFYREAVRKEMLRQQRPRRLMAVSNERAWCGVWQAPAAVQTKCPPVSGAHSESKGRC